MSTFFGLSKRFEIIDRVEDWTGKDHDDEPFFYYLYRCSLYRGELLVAESDGSCNSWEVKYRYRKQERTCPNCGAENIRKSKNDGGWYCWAKTGGCGATFKAGDESIESQEVGRKPNPDIADQVNTFQKMAQKRALVAAVLIAVNASDYFTQDMEDFTNIPLKTVGDVVEGEYTEQPQNGKQSPPKPQQKPKATQPQKLTGFPAIVAEVNTELGKEHYTIPHAQNTCKKLIDDFKMPGPNDTEALAGVKQILLDHANAPQGDDEVPF